jgi:fucose 4-O-acetylase-like acetyltransferase
MRMLATIRGLADRAAGGHDRLNDYGHRVADSFRLPGSASRDFRIDAMKGLAIILVVLGHAIQLYDPRLMNSLPRLVIYSFHMPLFFFLSGYVAFASARKYTADKLLSKRFKNLIIPFLSWYFIIGAAWILLFSNTGLRQYSWTLVDNPIAGRWFLLVLFWCFVLLVLANWLAGRLKVFAYLLVLFVPIVIPLMLGLKMSTSLLGFSMVSRVLPFFFAGYLLFEYKDGIAGFLTRHKALTRSAASAVLLAFPLLIVVSLLIGHARSPVFAFYMWTPVSPFSLGHVQALAVASLGSAWVFSVFELKRSRKGISWLAWLGNYTLDIFVIHMAAYYFILRVLAGPLHATSGVVQFFAVILMTVCAIAFSLFVSIFVLRRSKILAFTFLGKPYERAPGLVPQVEEEYVGAFGRTAA